MRTSTGFIPLTKLRKLYLGYYPVDELEESEYIENPMGVDVNESKV